MILFNFSKWFILGDCVVARIGTFIHYFQNPVRSIAKEKTHLILFNFSKWFILGDCVVARIGTFIDYLLNGNRQGGIKFI